MAEFSIDTRANRTSRAVLIGELRRTSYAMICVKPLVLQARDILRARRKLGLSQADLARRAGIRAETLNRIEKGKNTASVPTIAKIDRALNKAMKVAHKADLADRD